MKTILALAFLISAAANADSFLIERIDVNAAKRIPAAAVVAETRLDAGKTYTREQIEQALNRVRRLPFVLHADADLQPGSTPGARVLRINVEEMANFNWNLDLGAVGRPRYGSGVTAHGGAGYRFFPNRNGTLDTALAGSNESYLPDQGTVRTAELAYNAWSLFGTRAYGRIAAGTVFHPNSRHDINPSLLLGVPLTRTQSIELTAGRITQRSQERFSGIAEPVDFFFRRSSVALTWLRQTTDDPYFARRGFDAGAGPEWQRWDIDEAFLLTFPRPPHLQPEKQKQRYIIFNADAAKYWPLRQASAAFARFDGFTKRINEVVNGNKPPAIRWNQGDLLFGVAHDFNRELGEDTQRRWRLEAGIGYHYEKIDQVDPRNNSGAQLEIGTAYRNRFGLVHLSLSYVAR
jgi:outer membrane protein assembly factor BamA